VQDVDAQHGNVSKDPLTYRDFARPWKVSETPLQSHARSQVLSGAMYQLFVSLYEEGVESGTAPAQAVCAAAATLGELVMHSTEHVPEQDMTLHDVALGYLTTDRELFGGKHHDRLVKLLIESELITQEDVDAWAKRLSELPTLTLPAGAEAQDVAALIPQSLDALGFGTGAYGLRVERFERDAAGRGFARLELTEGKQADAKGLGRYGLITFRPDGTVSDYLPPVSGVPAELDELLFWMRQLGVIKKAEYRKPLAEARAAQPKD
jgi:hypothetical protein